MPTAYLSASLLKELTDVSVTPGAGNTGYPLIWDNTLGKWVASLLPSSSISGLGTMAPQAADNVAITGGSVSGISQLIGPEVGATLFSGALIKQSRAINAGTGRNLGLGLSKNRLLGVSRIATISLSGAGSSISNINSLFDNSYATTVTFPTGTTTLELDFQTYVGSTAGLSGYAYGGGLIVFYPVSGAFSSINVTYLGSATGGNYVSWGSISNLTNVRANVLANNLFIQGLSRLRFEITTTSNSGMRLLEWYPTDIGKLFPDTGVLGNEQADPLLLNWESKQIINCPEIEINSITNTAVFTRLGKGTLSITGTTPSTSTTSGCATFNGGLGVAGAIHGGSSLTLASDASAAQPAIVAGTNNGLKIGTATSQKLGFFDATPVVQPTTGVAEAAYVENSGGVNVNDDSTFDGYTLRQVVKALRNLGILA